MVGTAAPLSIATISENEVTAVFVERLRARRHDVARIASFWNGFEGWLKYELGLALCEKYGCRPWVDGSAHAAVHSIGVECKAPLKTDLDRAAGKKQVDLWVSSDPRQWHYVELKVVFCQTNEGKQVGSWRNDLRLLEQINEPNVDGRIALIVLVGFNGPEAVANALDVPISSVEWVADRHDDGPNSTPSIAVAARSVRAGGTP